MRLLAANDPSQNAPTYPHLFWHSPTQGRKFRIALSGEKLMLGSWTNSDQDYNSFSAVSLNNYECISIPQDQIDTFNKTIKNFSESNNYVRSLPAFSQIQEIDNETLVDKIQGTSPIPLYGKHWYLIPCQHNRELAYAVRTFGTGAEQNPSILDKPDLVIDRTGCNLYLQEYARLVEMPEEAKIEPSEYKDAI